MIAFFDMDKTLLACNTGSMWARYLHRNGEMPLGRLLQTSWWMLLYNFALLDMPSVSARVVGQMAGDSEEELRKKCQQWMVDEVVRHVRQSARDAIARHREKGETCVILSSSSPYATQPLREILRLDDVVCSELEVVQGRFTGRVAELCYGAGKVPLAERFAERRGAKLQDCAFYTDSFTDVPMLVRVGRPRVVNPDLRLRREARRRGWPIEEWS